MESLRVVCVGGGLGAPTVMAGLRAYTDDITGLIAVTDYEPSARPGLARPHAEAAASALVLASL